MTAGRLAQVYDFLEPMSRLAEAAPSRATVIKLLDEAKIPFERVGSHRRILLRDLLAYREQRRAEQHAALEATAVSLDDEQDLDTVLGELREARHAVATRRRARGATQPDNRE